VSCKKVLTKGARNIPSLLETNGVKDNAIAITIVSSAHVIPAKYL
jgi:hypothetical protein